MKSNPLVVAALLPFLTKSQRISSVYSTSWNDQSPEKGLTAIRTFTRCPDYLEWNDWDLSITGAEAGTPSPAILIVQPNNADVKIEVVTAVFNDIDDCGYIYETGRVTCETAVTPQGALACGDELTINFPGGTTTATIVIAGTVAPEPLYVQPTVSSDCPNIGGDGESGATPASACYFSFDFRLSSEACSLICGEEADCSAGSELCDDFEVFQYGYNGFNPDPLGGRISLFALRGESQTFLGMEEEQPITSWRPSDWKGEWVNARIEPLYANDCTDEFVPNYIDQVTVAGRNYVWCDGFDPSVAVEGPCGESNTNPCPVTTVGGNYKQERWLSCGDVVELSDYGGLTEGHSVFGYITGYIDDLPDVFPIEDHMYLIPPQMMNVLCPVMCERHGECRMSGDLCPGGATQGDDDEVCACFDLDGDGNPIPVPGETGCNAFEGCTCTTQTGNMWKNPFFKPNKRFEHNLFAKHAGFYEAEDETTTTTTEATSTTTRAAVTLPGGGVPYMGPRDSDSLVGPGVAIAVAAIAAVGIIVGGTFAFQG